MVIRCRRRRRMINDHKIGLGEFMLHATESLAGMTFQSISLNSQAGMPFADSKAESSLIALMKMRADHKEAVFTALAVLKDVLEISTSQQALMTAKDKRCIFHQSTLDGRESENVKLKGCDALWRVDA